MLSRHKKHCATDALIGHCKANWNIWNGYYPMRLEHIRSIEVYKIKNDRWWNQIQRWHYVYTNDYDKKNFIFSNMEKRKCRCVDPYIFKMEKI